MVIRREKAPIDRIRFAIDLLSSSILVCLDKRQGTSLDLRRWPCELKDRGSAGLLRQRSGTPVKQETNQALVSRMPERRCGVWCPRSAARERAPVPIGNHCAFHRPSCCGHAGRESLSDGNLPTTSRRCVVQGPPARRVRLPAGWLGVWFGDCQSCRPGHACVDARPGEDRAGLRRSTSSTPSQTTPATRARSARLMNAHFSPVIGPNPR